MMQLVRCNAIKLLDFGTMLFTILCKISGGALGDFLALYGFSKFVVYLVMKLYEDLKIFQNNTWNSTLILNQINNQTKRKILRIKMRNKVVKSAVGLFWNIIFRFLMYKFKIMIKNKYRKD